MNDWSHGYDVSVAYTYGFCAEMAPDWLDLCARLAGVTPKRGRSSSFRYLELGTGQGMGLCLLAAANPDAEFVGVDFLPEHIEHAEKIAEAAGLSNVRFSSGDFIDLAKTWPEDFGTFDYVSLHGVYTWVSPEVRQAVLACLRNATHAGSIVYNGYNTQPGWLGTMPFQHIARLLQDSGGKAGPAVISESISLFDDLLKGGADTFRILPGLKARLESVKKANPTYLVHEYLNEHWNPRWHSEVAKEFASVGLGYVGTATVAETMMPEVLPSSLRGPILSREDGPVRQDLQDFVVNQSFRRDISCRDNGGNSGRDIADISQTQLLLLSPPAAGSNLEINAAFGELTLQPPAFSAVVNALREGPRTIAELSALPETRSQGAEVTLRILLLLLHARVLGVAAAAPMSTDAAQRLNTVIAQGAVAGLPYDHIAAPALGSAIPASNVELMMLDAWLRSPEGVDSNSLARMTASRLAQLGRGPTIAGKKLEGAKAHEILDAQAKAFLEHIIPKWRALGAVA